MTELDAAIEQIERGPRQWPPYLGGTRRYLFHRFPFFVVFRETGTRIEIVAVAHGRRRPGYAELRLLPSEPVQRRALRATADRRRAGAQQDRRRREPAQSAAALKVCACR